MPIDRMVTIVRFGPQSEVSASLRKWQPKSKAMELLGFHSLKFVSMSTVDAERLRIWPVI